MNYDDGVKERTLRRRTSGSGVSLNADQGIHQGYVRMRLSYDDFNPGTGYNGDEDDLDGPKLDRGWYQLDLANSSASEGRWTFRSTCRSRFGRDYAMFGTGYALSIPMDMVQINSGFGPFKLGYPPRPDHSQHGQPRHLPAATGTVGDISTASRPATPAWPIMNPSPITSGRRTVKTTATPDPPSGVAV